MQTAAQRERKINKRMKYVSLTPVQKYNRTFIRFNFELNKHFATYKSSCLTKLNSLLTLNQTL